MIPTEISVSRNGSDVAVRWPDGSVSRLAAPLLRANCRSAPALRDRHDGKPAANVSGVSITALEPVGGYGLNVRFSDGHDRGIYPWGYLRELAERPARTASDFIDG
jgi:DUF971 family protein